MIYRLVVPGPFDQVDSVRVLEWHGAVGSVFQSGDLIVELETNKAVVEVLAGQPGVLRTIIEDVGGWLRIGGTLAFLSDDADEALRSSTDDVPLLRVDFEIT